MVENFSSQRQNNCRRTRMEEHQETRQFAGGLCGYEASSYTTFHSGDEIDKQNMANEEDRYKPEAENLQNYC